MGLVVGHVVEHVEEDGVREGFDRAFRQPLWLAHIVALWEADVHCEAVTKVHTTSAQATLFKLVFLGAGWRDAEWTCKYVGLLRGLAVAELLVHYIACVLFVVFEVGIGRQHRLRGGKRRHKPVCKVPANQIESRFSTK